MTKIRRLFICASVLVIPLLCWTGEVRAHDMANMAMPATFANSYAYTRSYTYDPTVGTAGTISVTVAATGAMQPNQGIPCNTLHTAVFHLNKADGTALKNPDGSVMGNVYGTPTAACSNMAFSHTFAVDADLNGCHLIDLYSGNCQFEAELEISCPVMGLFAIKWFDIQFEDAETHSVISALLKANGWHPQAPYCSIPSSPADLEPATQADANTLAGQYVEVAFMWREVPWGQSLTGAPWHRALPITPEHLETPTFEAPDCTQWDNHYRGVPPVYTP